MGTPYYVFCSGVLVEDQMQMTRLKVMPHCGTNETCGARMATIVGESDEAEFSIAIVSGCVLLLVYIFWSFVFQRCKWLRFMHETGFSVIVGLLIGLGIKLLYDDYVDFNYEIFSLIVLPLVILSAGYNLPRKSFFKYIVYIAGLGIGATVCLFVLIFYSTNFVDFKTIGGQAFDLTDHQRLVLASVLASTDTVAPMAFLPVNAFPEIYAVVFGEGVLNDVVAILLNAAATKTDTLSTNALLAIFGQIFYLLFTSLAMGLSFGFVTSLIFKYMRELKAEDQVLKPVATMFLMNFLCYVVSELLGLSSIFALFFCALLCGHYAAESMGHDAKHITAEVTELMAYLAEAFVFGYFGLTSIRYLWTGFYSMSFILYCIGSIFVSRIVAVAVVLLTLRVIRCGHSLALSLNEFGIIGFAGCMRGTIAYALILKSVPHEAEESMLDDNQRIMLSTVQGVVLINCLFFGGLFPLILCLFRVKPVALNEGPLLCQDARSFSLGVEQPSTMTDDTRGFLPRHHPLRPNNLRREVTGRWRQFDEGRMRKWFTAQKHHVNSAALDIESGGDGGPRLLGAQPMLFKQHSKLSLNSALCLENVDQGAAHADSQKSLPTDSELQICEQ
jgi:NhaP-type Na+/H+ or K+/H+ antiporter